MKRGQLDRVLLCVGIGCYFCMACSFLIMPFDWAGILPGLLFWLGLLAGIVCMVLLGMRRKQFLAEHRNETLRCRQKRCGALTFFSNRAAQIADVCLPVAWIGSIVALAVADGYVCYAFIAAAVFTLSMHCVLNGRIFRYAVYEDTIRNKPKEIRKNGKGEENL